MVGQPLLLITQSMLGHPSVTRAPLDRISLPIAVGARNENPPTAHVWWVERHKQSLRLRARCHVINASRGDGLDMQRRQLTWHLDVTTSERITWPGTGQSDKSNVTHLVGGIVPAVGNGVVLLPIADNLDVALERRRQEISTDVLSLDHARRALRRLFQHTALYLAAAEPIFSFEQAWCRVHAYFAREELVSIAGHDPYAVAAAVLAGCREVPSVVAEEVDVDEAVLCQDDGFSELDEQQIDQLDPWHVERQVPLDLALLEYEARRHQQIVKALAQQVRDRGFLPTYSKHVDLRVGCPYDDVLFEVKTTNPANFLEQVRRAVGQLLEYRFRYRRPDTERQLCLVAVLEASASTDRHEFVRQFLADVSITTVFCDPNSFEFDGLDYLLPVVVARAPW